MFSRKFRTNGTAREWVAVVLLGALVACSEPDPSQQRQPVPGEVTTSTLAVEDDAAARETLLEAASVPYILPRWRDALLSGRRLTRDSSDRDNILSLQVYGMTLRHAPSEMFDDYDERAYFASILDCERLTEVAHDEFALREVVEEQFAAVKAAAAALPNSTITVSGAMQVSEYDFDAGRFDLGEPELDGQVIPFTRFMGGPFGLQREYATAVYNNVWPLRQDCEAIGRRNIQIAARWRMRPYYFETPTHFQMSETAAREFAAEISPSRRLMFVATLQPARGGAHGGRVNDPDFPGPSEVYGAFIDLDIVGWRVSTEGGRVLASSP